MQIAKVNFLDIILPLTEAIFSQVLIHSKSILDLETNNGFKKPKKKRCKDDNIVKY